jgi:hypothetical protein
MALNVFEAGKGINAVKINYNFSELQQTTNNNESAINAIANTALLKDGSNLTQSIINKFQQQTPNIITGAGTISLLDNSSNFLTLTGNGTILLPTITSDPYSHTIILVIEGSSYSLDIGTTKSLGNAFSIDSTKPYQVIYIYNKIDSSWYYCLGQ